MKKSSLRRTDFQYIDIPAWPYDYSDSITPSQLVNVNLESMKAKNWLEEMHVSESDRLLCILNN